jgi:membrane protein implicated in regulation of membrane protease activity
MSWESWQPLAWLALAVLLGVAEVLGFGLVLLMLAGGAVAGMITALFHAPVAAQVVVAVVTSIGILALVRPNLVKRLDSGPELRLGPKALIGRQGIVVDEVSAHAGQIRIGGELWTARPYDETQVIEAGATVDIFEIRGATALVYKVPSLDS